MGKWLSIKFVQKRPHVNRIQIVNRWFYSKGDQSQVRAADCQITHCPLNGLGQIVLDKLGPLDDADVATAVQHTFVVLANTQRHVGRIAGRVQRIAYRFRYRT